MEGKPIKKEDTFDDDFPSDESVQGMFQAGDCISYRPTDEFQPSEIHYGD